jgi:hypothetical protein
VGELLQVGTVRRLLQISELPSRSDSNTIWPGPVLSIVTACPTDGVVLVRAVIRAREMVASLTSVYWGTASYRR